MSTPIQEEFPPLDAFVRRGASHWYGRRRTKIAVSLPKATSLVGKTQIYAPNTPNEPPTAPRHAGTNFRTGSTHR